MPDDKLHWRDVEELAEALHEKHSAVDPLTLRFTQLRSMVESLAEFEPQPDHPCNEAILEAIQADWIELASGQTSDEDDD